MARWGEFKYNSKTKWGATPTHRRLTWGVLIDWSNDGTYSYGNENLHVLEMNVRRGRESFMQSGGAGFQRRFAGNTRITLRNNDKRYDPFNISGPLYGKLEQNQKVKIIVKDESTGTIYPIFFGRIDDIRPNYGVLSTVTLTASDAITSLSKGVINTSSVSLAVQYDQAVSNLLTAFGWTDAIDIDTSSLDSMSYWWGDGTSAYNQLCNLTDAVIGNFYVSADGTATYRPRIVDDTIGLTFTDADVLWEWNVRSPSPRETIKNRVQVYARARKSVASATLWTMGDIPYIPAGESRTIWAQFSYNAENVPATTITPPAATTDYAMSTVSGGGGTDLTASFTVATTNFSTTAKLVVTNGSALGGYVNLLKLRGTVIVSDNYTYSEASDPTSIANYGERLFTVQSDWLQSATYAISQANTVLGLLDTPRYYPQFMLRGKPSQQFSAELNMLVAISLLTIGLGANMRIGYIEHNVRFAQAGGNICDTLLYFEPNFSSGTGGTSTVPVTIPFIAGA